MNSLLTTRAACIFALTLASNLFAVDGVILIDQNRALAGNVTPGDTPGFPVTISMPGSYRLSGNLTLPDRSTTGVEITAGHVTLDLNGFSIIGPVVCTSDPTNCGGSGGGVGVHAGSFSPGVVAPSAVKVMNGTVRGMGFHGVRLMGDGTVVERVIARSNGGPGIVVGAGSVIDCAATLNGASGIIGLLVRDSTALENGSTGIFVRDHGVATGNVAYLNATDGITAARATLKGNTAGLNKGAGFNITCPATLVDNTAIGNQAGGYKTTGAVCIAANNSQ